MTTTTPPAPGLTRTDTGFPSGVYAGWYRTPADLAEQERIAGQRRSATTTDDFAERPIRAVPAATLPGQDWRRRTGTTEVKAPLPLRNCRVCGNEFPPVRANNVYCTPNCRARAAEQNRPPRKRTEAPPTHVTATCVMCGREFEAVNRGAKTRKTCSQFCRGELGWKTQREGRAA